MVKYGKDDDIFYSLSTAGFVPRWFIMILLALSSVGIFSFFLVFIGNRIEFGGFLIAMIVHDGLNIFMCIGLVGLDPLGILIGLVRKCFIQRKWRL